MSKEAIKTAILGLNNEKAILTEKIGRYGFDTSKGIALSSRLEKIDRKITELLKQDY